MNAALRYKNNIRVIKITPEDVINNSNLIQMLKDQISVNEDIYPNIDNWFDIKVIPGILKGLRTAYLGYLDNEPIATAIVKLGKSAKFCHLKIKDEFCDKSIGDLFFTLMTFDVRKHTEEIHFTLPESLWEKKEKFFNSFGFDKIVNSGYFYRTFEKELVCSSSFDKVWSNIQDKLPKILPNLTINGHDLGDRLLMSVKPDYVVKILDGTKRIEIRRKFHHNWIGHNVVLYSSFPMKCVVGEVKIKNVYEDKPEVIWGKFSDELGCSKDEFFNYTKSLDTAYAIEFAEVSEYENKVPLSKIKNIVNEKLRPPQSYQSVKPSCDWYQALSYVSLIQDSIKQSVR